MLPQWLISGDPTAWSRTARPMLRHWLSSWSGSVLLHGAAVYCFVAVAQSGPQAWPVVRGRASVASAPAIDARAGGLLGRVSKTAEPMTIEFPSTTTGAEPPSAPKLDHSLVAEIAQAQVTLDADALIQNEFSTIVRQLHRNTTEQSESQRIRALIERPSIRQTELNRPLQTDNVESQAQPVTSDEPRETSAVETGQAAREGDSKQDSKAATGSATSRGAEANEQPIKLASNPDPEYPEEAKAARLQGRVVLSIRVGIDGRVESLKLLRSSGVTSMDESAMKTVKNWRFEPAKRFGRPIVMEIRHAIRFEFEKE
ncbi:MAG: energy transducer TonB [Planctomycetia bacterium]|nr:energy transducer TonB [Planctomycetia bacterium]